MAASKEKLLTTWAFTVVASAEAEITGQTDEWINYTATVILTDHQGFARFGDPVKIRHTAYFSGDGELEQPEDAQDFAAFNDDMRAAYGAFADSRLRDLVLAAIFYAAQRAWQELIEE